MTEECFSTSLTTINAKVPLAVNWLYHFWRHFSHSNRCYSDSPVAAGWRTVLPRRTQTAQGRVWHVPHCLIGEDWQRCVSTARAKSSSAIMLVFCSHRWFWASTSTPFKLSSILVWLLRANDHRSYVLCKFHRYEVLSFHLLRNLSIRNL